MREVVPPVLPGRPQKSGISLSRPTNAAFRFQAGFGLPSSLLFSLTVLFFAIVCPPELLAAPVLENFSRDPNGSSIETRFTVGDRIYVTIREQIPANPTITCSRVFFYPHNKAPMHLYCDTSGGHGVYTNIVQISPDQLGKETLIKHDFVVGESFTHWYQDGTCLTKDTTGTYEFRALFRDKTGNNVALGDWVIHEWTACRDLSCKPGDDRISILGVSASTSEILYSLRIDNNDCADHKYSYKIQIDGNALSPLFLTDTLAAKSRTTLCDQTVKLALTPGTHEFKVVLTQGVIEISDVQEFDVQADNLAPTISISHPNPDQYRNGKIKIAQGLYPLYIDWNGDDADDEAVVNVLLDVDLVPRNGNETYLALNQREDGYLNWDVSVPAPCTSPFWMGCRPYYILAEIYDGDHWAFDYSEEMYIASETPIAGCLDDWDCAPWPYRMCTNMQCTTPATCDDHNGCTVNDLSWVNPGHPTTCSFYDPWSFSNCWCRDSDQDEFVIRLKGLGMCPGWDGKNNDCNDQNPWINQGMKENLLDPFTCVDRLDNDCDGKADSLDTDCFSGMTDTDRDGLPDTEETQNYHTNPQNPDSDGDGLTDGEEVLIHGTDPRLRDSDNDGYDDRDEIERGMDPRDPSSHPVPLPKVNIGEVEHVVLVIIDGCRRDAFYELLADPNSDIPTLKEIIGPVSRDINDNFRFLGNAVGVNVCTTISPSVTFAAQASIITGAYPRQHGIPGNQWFDRYEEKERNYVGWGSGVPDAAQVYWNDLATRDLNRNIETIYEAAARNHNDDSMVAFHMYGRGAERAWVKPCRQDLRLFMPDLPVVPFSEWYDHNMFYHLANGIEHSDKRLPTILTLYLAGHDHYSHMLGNDGFQFTKDAQREYLKTVIESHLDKLVHGSRIYHYPRDIINFVDWSGLETLPGNPLDKTVFVFVADHGQTEAPSAIDRDDIKDSIKSIADESGFFRNDDNIRYGFNEGVIGIYIKHRNPSTWILAPGREDVGVVARALKDGLLFEYPLLEYLKDFVIVGREGFYEDYKVFDGDRFRFYQESTPEMLSRHELDLIWNANVGERSGDVLLILRKPGLYLRTHNESTHGSMSQTDLRVPLVFAGKPLARILQPGDHTVKEARIVDVAPTIASLLGFEWGQGARADSDASAESYGQSLIQSEYGVLTGAVYDLLTDENLSDGLVIEGPGGLSTGTTAAQSGPNYALRLAPGTHTICASRPGYGEACLSDISAGAAQAVQLDIGLVSNRTLEFRANGKIDLEATGPDGGVVSKGETSLPGARYFEGEFDGDGQAEDRALIPAPSEGVYSVAILAQPDANPEETYSVAALVFDGTTILAEGIPISAIPEEPYLFSLGNTAPHIRSSPIENAVEDGLYSYTVGGEDANGDPLTYLLVDSPEDMTIHGTTGRIEWTPTGDQVGEAKVVVRVEDGRGGEDQQIFSITVQNTNDPPVLEDFVPLEDDPAVDEGDPLFFHVDVTDGDHEELAYVWYKDGEQTAEGSPWVYVPRFDETGLREIEVRVTDGESEIEHAWWVTVNDANVPPRFTSNPVTQAYDCEAYAYQAGAEDYDGDHLEYSVVSPPSPAGMQINAQTGLVSWGPGETDEGDHTVSLEASDGRGGVAAQEYLLTVVRGDSDGTPPTPPRVLDDGFYTTKLAQLHAQWFAEDPESGISEYEYAVGTSPGGVDVVPWTKAGAVEEVTHGGLELATAQTYYFTVRARNRACGWSEGYSDGIMAFAVDQDEDGDGLKNEQEITLYMTDPLVEDTDGDGLADGEEVQGWGDRWDDDPDHDRLVNLLDPDSDNDGMLDGQDPDTGTPNLRLHAGLNLFSYAVSFSDPMDSYGLLMSLGTETEVERIWRYDPVTNEFQTTYYHEGSPDGDLFEIQPGEGYLVRMHVDKVWSFSGGDIPCPDLDLKTGFNLKGLSCFAQGYGSYDLLDALGGQAAVSSVQRLDPETGQFQSTTYLDGQHTGPAYSIRAGEAYLLYMHVDRPDFRP